MALTKADIQVNDIIAQIKAQLGDSEAPFTDLSDPIAVATMRFANSLVGELRSNLQNELNPPRDGSGLAQSIAPRPTKESQTLVVQEIEMNDYWSYVEHGVSGAGGEGWNGVVHRSTAGFQYKDKAPPISAVQSWIPQTGFTAPNGWSYESWSYVIAQNIRKRGLEPKPFVQPSLSDENIAVLQEALAEITGQTVVIVFDKIEE